MKLTIFQYQNKVCKVETQEEDREKVNKVAIRISNLTSDNYKIKNNFLFETIKNIQKNEGDIFIKLDFVQCELSGSCLNELNAELEKCNINNYKYKNFTLEIGSED
ncbi:MAG: hypothetical protein K2W92_06830 [Alphaproteobacteria bacterium]|nr:hypothetical protein [Alphaproteobacteria bacterium]